MEHLMTDLHVLDPVALAIYQQVVSDLTEEWVAHGRDPQDLPSDNVAATLAYATSLEDKTSQDVGQQVVASMEALMSGGLNASVHQSLRTLAHHCKQYAQQERHRDQEITSSNPDVPILVLNELIALDASVRAGQWYQDILSQLSAIKAPAHDNLDVNEDFPMRAERAAWALKCVASACGEVRNALSFLTDDMRVRMVSMFINDAFNHYNLGVAVLGGDPKQINHASTMDTASREGLDKEVWEFVSQTIFDRAVFGPQALEAHRQKVLEEKARAFNDVLSQEVGGAPQKSTPPRKI